MSPGSKYQVTASGSSQVDLAVRRVTDGVTVLHETFPIQSAWGFSPDDNRFVIHDRASGVEHVVLYDLSTGNAATQRWQTSVSSGTSGLGFSPGGKYMLYAANAGSTSVTLDVIDASSGAKILESNGSVSGWGFSPDDDRMTLTSIVSGVTMIEMYDLSTTPVAKRWTGAIATSGLFVGYSPSGAYLLVAYLTGTNTATLDLVDTATGSVRYTTSYTFSTFGGSHQNPVGVTGWGFGPDKRPSFVYAFVATSQGQATLTMVDPAAGLARATVSIPIAGFWKFSPCGNALAVVYEPDPSTMAVSLLDTATGSQLANRSFPIGSITFTSTATDQVATVSSGDVVLAPNSAGQPCPPTAPVLSTVSLGQARTIGGATNSGTVTLDKAAPSGGTAVTLSSSDGSAQPPASVTVAAGELSAPFTVTTTPVAVDTAVTITATAGLSKTARLTVLPPLVTSVTAPATVVGGAPVPLTVNIGGPAPASGLDVALSSENSAVSVPSTAHIPGGATSVSLQATSQPVDPDVSVRVTATGPDASVAFATVLITTPKLVSVIVNPCCLPSGGTSTGTVTLSSPAPASGITVALASDSAALGVPPNVIVAGAASATFPVTASSVTTVAFVAVTATLNSSAKSAGVTVLPAGGAAPDRYTLTDLGPAADGDQALSINNSGDVVGTAYNPAGGLTPFLWSHGTRVDLGTLPNLSSPITQGINDQGDIVGYASTVTSQGFHVSHAVIWHAGATHQIEDIGETLSAGNSRAAAINNAGTVTGQLDQYLSGSNYRHRAFRWQAGTVSLPALLPGTPDVWWNGSQGNALNDAGVIVGTTQADSGNGNNGQDAASWDPQNAITDLDPYQAAGLRPFAINSAGVIAGSGSAGPVIIANGKTFTLCNSNTVARAVALNDNGQVLGFGAQLEPWIWNPSSGWTALDTLTTLPAGWVLGRPTSINLSGQIVGAGTVNGAPHGYLLTPGPPDTTPPTLTGLTPATGAYVRGTSVPVTGAATDGASGSGIAQLAFTVDNGSVIAPVNDTVAPYGFTLNSTLLAQGSHTISVVATDSSGKSSTPLTHTFTVDNVAPAKPYFTRALAPFTTATTATVFFHGTDATSGVSSYRVQVKKASYSATGFGAWYTPSGASALTGSAYTLSGLAAGYDYCFRVYSRDKAGNVSVSSNPACTARLVDDHTAVHSTGWSQLSGTGYFLGTFSLIKRLGASLSLTGFRGDRLAVLATTCATCGSIKVYVGTTLIRTISLVSTTTHKSVLLTIPLFSSRTGTVKMVTASTKPVTIDGIGLSRT